MKWIWIRHGETDANREKRYLGHYDVPLNQKGVEEVCQLAPILKENLPTVVYSSDLSRCRQTAELLIGDMKMSVVTECALREINFGEWDHQTYREIYSHSPKQLESWYRDPFNVSPPGGETLGQFGRRVDEWIQHTHSSLSENDTIWIISHGGVIRWFMSRWLQGDPSQFWKVRGISHAQALMADWDGRAWASILLNDQPEGRVP